MFKPTNFRLKNTIYWPGIGPANEIAASNILKVVDEGEDYMFVHASGSAVKVPKAQVTAYGVYDADDVPNLPSEGDYKDGNDADTDTDTDTKDTPTRTGGNSTPLPTEPLQPEAPQGDAQADEGGDAPSDIEPVDTDTSADNADKFQSSDPSEVATPSGSDDAVTPPSTDNQSSVEADTGDTDSTANDANAVDSGSTGDVVSDTPVYTDPNTDDSFNTPSASFGDVASDDGDVDASDDGEVPESADSDADADTSASDDDVEPTPAFTLGKKTKGSKKKYK